MKQDELEEEQWRDSQRQKRIIKILNILNYFYILPGLIILLGLYGIIMTALWADLHIQFVAILGFILITAFGVGLLLVIVAIKHFIFTLFSYFDECVHKLTDLNETIERK